MSEDIIKDLRQTPLNGDVFIRYVGFGVCDMYDGRVIHVQKIKSNITFPHTFSTFFFIKFKLLLLHTLYHSNLTYLNHAHKCTRQCNMPFTQI